jgi:hypothetical protein
LKATKLISNERPLRSSISSEADPVLLLPVIMKGKILVTKKNFTIMCRLLRGLYRTKKLLPKCILFKTSQTEMGLSATMPGLEKAIRKRE